MNIRKLIRKEVRKVMDASELDAARERLKSLEIEGAPQSKIAKEKNTIKALEKGVVQTKNKIKENEELIKDLRDEMQDEMNSIAYVGETYALEYFLKHFSKNKRIKNDTAFANKFFKKNKSYIEDMDLQINDYLDSKTIRILGLEGQPLTKAQSMQKFNIDGYEYDRYLDKWSVAFERISRNARKKYQMQSKELKRYRKIEEENERQIESLEKENERLKKTLGASRSSIFKM